MHESEPYRSKAIEQTGENGMAGQNNCTYLRHYLAERRGGQEVELYLRGSLANNGEGHRLRILLSS
jgi:hypothetical protein